MRLTPWLSMFSKSPTRRNLNASKTKRRSVVPQLEALEDRVLLSVNTLYVDNAADLVVTNDQGAPGLDNGDTVTWNPGAGSALGAAVPGLTFGTTAFSSIGAAYTAGVN